MRRRCRPEQFRQLVALAIQAAEHLLWPDPPQSLPAQAPERRSLLRKGLLPRRLRKEFENLSKKEQWRRAQAAPLPPWLEWEIPLDATIDLIDRGLAASVAPAEITSATLESLLLLPRATLVGQYLYQSSVGEWLRATLPKDLPDAAALLRYCRVVAEALGPWPQNTYGAPASAEQASRAVFWYAKLRLEAQIIDIPGRLCLPASASKQPGGDLQTLASRWLLWLTSGTLPAEALELITVLAPLIGRVLFQSSWEAANQDRAALCGAAPVWRSEKHRRDFSAVETASIRHRAPKPQ